MVNELLSAVSNAIWNEFHQDFGDDMLIAKEIVEQELTPPCFTIRCIEPNIKPQLKGMINTIHSFEVCFFPSAGNQQINDVSERLQLAFEIIETVGTNPIKYQCTNKNGTVSDGVLVFTFDIETYMTQPYEKEDDMEDVIIETPIVR